MSQEGNTKGYKTLSYEVRRSPRRKRLAIEVGTAGVIVRAPTRTSERAISRFIAEHRDWIHAKLEHYQQFKPPIPRFQDGETVLYKGIPHTLALQPNLNLPIVRITLQDQQFLIQTGPAVTETQIRAGLIRWYKKQAQIILPPRVQYYAEQIRQPVANILIRDQKRRWGSCNSQGEIRLNWRLMMMPEDVIEYIVAHEVAHLQELNHSPAFWAVVKRLMPHYKMIQKRLKAREHLYAF